MPVFNNALAGAAGSGGADAGYKIEKSLRFNFGDTSYVERTPSTPGNRKTWTYSAWVKRTGDSTTNSILVAGSGGADTHNIYFNGTGASATLVFSRYVGSFQVYLETDRVFRDPSAWYHIVVAYDTTLGTAADRVKIYVNGIRETTFTSSTYPGPNAEYEINSNVVHRVGRYSDLLIAEAHFVDGQALDPVNVFGKFDEDTGVWNPIEYTHAAPASTTAITNVSSVDNTRTISVTAAGWQQPDNAVDSSDSSVSPSNNNTPGTITFSPALVGVTKVRAKTRFYGSGTAKLYNGSTEVHSVNHNNNNATQYYTIYEGPPIEITQYWQQMNSSAASDDFWALEVNDTIVATTSNGGNLITNISGAAITLTTTDNSNYSSFSAGGYVNNGAQISAIDSSTPSITVNSGSWNTGANITAATNSFYLDFSNTSSQNALGTDNSGNNNTFTVTNLEVGDSGTTLSTATGALPILNTSGDYGGTVTSGVRSDSNSSNIVLALPLNGSSGSTTITDYHHTVKGSGSAKAITLFTGASSGGAVIDTSQSQYYGSSFYAARGNVNQNQSDYITRTGDTDLNFGTGDFTVEFWYRPKALHSNIVMFDNRHPTTNWPNSSNGFALVGTGSGHMYLHSGGSNRISTAPDLVAGKWTHICITRDSGTTTFRSNGVNRGSFQDSNNYDEGRFTLGSSSPNGEGSDGHFADLRIYKGVAKYVVDFTVPSSPDFSNTDSFIDTPTNYEASSGNNGGNYATWNPLAKNSSTTLSNGNLDATSNQVFTTLSTIGFPSSGKFYGEFTVSNTSAGYPFVGIGAFNDTGITNNSNPNTGAFYAQGGYITGGVSVSSLGTLSAGDIVGVAYDAATRQAWFRINGGSWINSGNPATGANPTCTLPVNDNGYGWACSTYQHKVSLNAGQRPFHTDPPSGFKSLCTQNLDDPLIPNPSKQFDIDTWSGNGNDPRARTLSFGPDLVWIKTTNQTNWHHLTDSVRGAPRKLYANEPSAEDATPQFGQIDSLNSDGFTLGGGTDNTSPLSDSNQVGHNFVAWAWNGGDLVTNTAYNQDAVWSNGISGSALSNYPATNGFNGDTSTYFYAAANQTTTFTFSPAVSGTTFEVFMYGGGATPVTVNGTDAGSATGSWVNVSSQAGGSLSTIACVGGASSQAGFAAVRVDGKILVDAGVIPVGTITNSLYNQADWTGSTTATGIATNVGNDLASVFDGVLVNGTRAAVNGGTGTLEWTSGTIQGNVRIYTGIAGTQGFTYYNGSTSTTISSANNGWNDLGNIDLTRLDFDYSGGNITFVNAIELNGKILVQNGVSLPTIPAIASTATANTTAGFSIATYTGTGSNGSFGHGLNAQPKLVIVKTRTDPNVNWTVWHEALAATEYLTLNTGNDKGTQAAVWNSTAPTSEVIHVGTDVGTNKLNDEYVAYCFAPVEGYSKFGTYVGTGSAPGPFVYTGFRPKYVMMKNIAVAGEEWMIIDSARDTKNESGNTLYANTAMAQVDYGAINDRHIDILSNGFKVNRGNPINKANTHLYIAFAENPFKTARAR